jgi:hypothetical protein
MKRMLAVMIWPSRIIVAFWISRYMTASGGGLRRAFYVKGAPNGGCIRSHAGKFLRLGEECNQTTDSMKVVINGGIHLGFRTPI